MEAAMEDSENEPQAETLQSKTFPSLSKYISPTPDVHREKMILGCDVKVGVHRDRPPYSLFF